LFSAYPALLRDWCKLDWCGLYPSRQLGFVIESMQAAFPDCEAKIEVEPGRWQHFRIEFEYESRNFRDHRHDPDKCDLIVCWRHNWKDCPPNLQVLELSQVVRQMW
jgi:hypothetical protein